MSSLAALAPRLRFNETLLKSVIEGMDGPAWNLVPPGGGNTPHWILGHVAASRRFMLRAAGHALASEPWEALFGRGAAPGAATDGFPPVEELLTDVHASGEIVSELFPTMTDEAARAPAAQPMPDGSDTVAGMLHFLHFHETYHLGQLGLLRRMNGLDPFA